MTKENIRIPFCRIVLLSLSFFLFTASVAADFNMWVGQKGEYEMYGIGYYNFRVTRVSCTNPSVTCNLVGWLAKWEIVQYFPGTATIIIEYAYQVSRGESYKNDRKTLTVSCIDNPVTVSPSSLSLKTGEYYDLSYQFQNLRYVSRPSLQWSTDDRSGTIITVSSGGRVTAKGPGTATVYLDHSEGSNRGTCVVTVTGDGSAEPITPVQPDPPVQPQNNKLIVTASPWGGEVEKGTEVYLMAKTSDGTEVPNAWIHYTLDGSTPRTRDIEFSSSSPIVINEDCTVKAFAEYRGYSDSDVLTVKYTVKPKSGSLIEVTDLNGDGKMDEADIMFIVSRIMGTQKTDLMKADINGDTKVNAVDIVAYVKCLKTASTTGTLAGHEWVDLGLPSGTKWATCNVGASKPEDYGDYYAWGETSTKTNYSSSNYKNKDNYSLGDISGTSYDVAHVKWGSLWRMAKRAEWNELAKYCSAKAETKNGVKGTRYTGKNGNSIFLPWAGYRDGTTLKESYWNTSNEIEGHYFTSNGDAQAVSWTWLSGYGDADDLCLSSYGLSIRAVWK